MSSTRQNSSCPVQPQAEESHANLAKVRTQLFLDEAPRDGNTLAVLHQSARSQSQVRKHTSKKLERIMSPFSQ